jgi:hypothetical protein
VADGEDAIVGVGVADGAVSVAVGVADAASVAVAVAVADGVTLSDGLGVGDTVLVVVAVLVGLAGGAVVAVGDAGSVLVGVGCVFFPSSSPPQAARTANARTATRRTIGTRELGIGIETPYEVRMNRMRILLIATVVTALAASTSAESNTHAKLAEELLLAIGTPESIERSLPQMVQAQVIQAPQLEPYRDQIFAFYKETVGWKQMKNDLIPLYMKTFNEQEMRRMLEFYRSEVGRKAQEQLPLLVAQGAQLAVRRVQARLPELQKRIDAQNAPGKGGKP